MPSGYIGTILPAMAFEKALETTRIHSIADLLRPEVVTLARLAFRFSPLPPLPNFSL